MLSVPRNWAGWVTAAAVALLALFTAVEASSALGHAQRLRIVSFEDLKTAADAASRAHEARLALDRSLRFTGNRARSEMAGARAADEAFRKLLDRIDAAGEPEIGARLSACRNSWSAFRVLLRQTGNALESAPENPETPSEETLDHLHQTAMADLGNLRVAIDAAALRREADFYQALLLAGGGALSLSALALGVLSWRARERRRSLESQRQANRELAAAREALLLSHQTLEQRVRLRTAELEAEAARNQRIQEELAAPRKPPRKPVR